MDEATAAKVAKRAKASKKAPRKAKTKPSMKAKGKAAKPKKLRAAAPKKARGLKVKAKKVKAAKPRRMLRQQARPFIKKVIQGADAVALKALVDGLKANHLDAERVFNKMVQHTDPSVEDRARALVAAEGLNPRAAGVLAITVAKLEQLLHSLRTSSRPGRGKDKPLPIEVPHEATAEAQA